MTSLYATANRKEATMQPDPAPAPGLTGEAVRRWAAVQPASGDARICIRDTPERAELIAGLRSLADYLDTNSSVPAPPYGWKVAVHAEGTDSEQFAQVDLVSGIVGEQPVDWRAVTGHHHVQRSFGPVTYEFTAIAEWRMAQRRAGMSYAGSVVPDALAGPPARLVAGAFPPQSGAVFDAGSPDRAAEAPGVSRAAHRRGVTP